jgi:DnaK suppressor protein
MAKPKHGAAKRSGEQAKPAAKSAKARPSRKTAGKPASKAVRKPATKAARVAKKPAKTVARATKKPARTVAKTTRKPVTTATKAVKKPSTKKTASASIIKNKSKIVKKAAPSKQPQNTPAPRKPAPAKQTLATEHDATRTAHQAARKPVQHVRPTGGVAARLSVGAAAEQTITREDGRYALPAAVNIDLPKGYKPSPKEEYMGPRQLAYFRNKLREWREQLVEESRQTMENLREEVRDVGDDAERATRETENSLELRTRDRYRKLISKIDKALRRIEEGRYGFCEETDEEIGIERLEARPIATLSLDAQERREHLQKQMGD